MRTNGFIGIRRYGVRLPLNHIGLSLFTVDVLAISIESMLEEKTAQRAVKDVIIHENKNLVLTAGQKNINGYIGTITRLGSSEYSSWNTLKHTDDTVSLISSGADKGVISVRQSWIDQAFIVPKNMTNLKFEYSIAWLESMNFIGAGLDMVINLK